jgi:hypothetical protein
MWNEAYDGNYVSRFIAHQLLGRMTYICILQSVQMHRTKAGVVEHYKYKFAKAA